MRSVGVVVWFWVLVASGCAPTLRGVGPAGYQPTARCEATQARISQAADQRASPWSIEKHLAQNFPERQVSWVMTEATFQRFIVTPNAQRFGRCNDSGCHQFAAPGRFIRRVVQESMKDGQHDPELLGKALGIPAASLQGPLRLMTLDLEATGVCVRLPVEEDPGALKCATPESTDCFKFGGYTTGGVPEVMLINAPVAGAQIEQVP